MNGAELKQLVSAADVLRAYGVVASRESGRIPCPIHGGHNPSSFKYVGDRFYCFSCGAGGDVFSLVQAFEDSDFMAAFRIVAKIAGVDPDGRQELPLQVQRRAVHARRARALLRFRSRELLGLTDRLRSLCSHARRIGAGKQTRDGPDTERRLWGRLDRIYSAIDHMTHDLEFLESAELTHLATYWKQSSRPTEGNADE